MWHLSVPKVCHVYWGGGVLSYMRYLTVKSFIIQNPDWRVTLWTPNKPSKSAPWATKENIYPVRCTDYYKELLRLDIDIFEVDFDTFGFSNDMPEIHKSDYLRLYLLSEIGGVWSDMDIIYFKPMKSLYFNREKYKDVDTYVCINKHDRYIHSGGFLMSAPGSKYFARLEELARESYSPNTYQCIGVDMFNKHYPTIERIRELSPALNVGMDVVYAHNANQIRDMMGPGQPLFTENSIGIHWYAGSQLWGRFIEKTDGGRRNVPDSIIKNVLLKYDNC